MASCHCSGVRVSFTVELEDGRVFRRHVDHLSVRTAMTEPPVEISSQSPELPPADPPLAPAEQSLRRSTRPHKSPDRFGVAVRH